MKADFERFKVPFGEVESWLTSRGVNSQTAAASRSVLCEIVTGYIRPMHGAVPIGINGEVRIGSIGFDLTLGHEGSPPSGISSHTKALNEDINARLREQSNSPQIKLWEIYERDPDWVGRTLKEIFASMQKDGQLNIGVFRTSPVN